MNNRIKNMKENIRILNDAGVRRTTFYPLIAASLKETVGQPTPIRRAKAFAYLLDTVEQLVFPCELLAGSIVGMWPVDHDVQPYEVRKQEALKILQKHIADKADSENKEAGVNDEDGEDALPMKKLFARAKYRFALMGRDHYDANIDYSQLQTIISEMKEYFKNNDKIEGYEIARELERYFNYDYGMETRKLFDGLPWNVANHTDMNYKDVVKTGLGKIRDDIEKRLSKSKDDEQKQFYLSAKISIEAAIRYIYRYADTVLKESSSPDTEESRAKELREMADVIQKIAEGKPETFREAMQLMWMVHIIANTGGGSALSFARFDQYMYPFYERDIEKGIMTREEAAEIISCMWLKVNEPKMRTVQSATLAGVTPEGRDGATDLTRLCLEITADLRLPYPNVSVRINKSSPEWLYDEAVKTIRTGVGHPMILNDDLWVPNLQKLGYPPEIAREYYNMGCAEIMIQGKHTNWAISAGITFPAIIGEVLDKWKRKECALDTFEDFMGEYISIMKKQIEENTAFGLENLDIISKKSCDPFASALVEECLERGKDYFKGGTLCGSHLAMGGLGLGTATDSLSAINKFVYEDKKLTISELSQSLDSNFKDSGNLRIALDRSTPAYGNDIDRVDEIGARIYNTYCDEVFKYNTPQNPVKFVNVLFSYTNHVFIGEVTEATPNGRMRGEVLSDAIGPSQGKDVEGPTKLINTVLKLDHSKVTGAFALNMKINPTLVKDEAGGDAIKALIKAYIAGGGPQIQFNFVDPDTLKEAQLHPEKHGDIVVRVAGYCEYFVNLDRTLQNEIIKRTIHDL